MAKDRLPRRVLDYLQETGVRALDHLAEHLETPRPASTAGAGSAPPAATPVQAVQMLVEHWKTMSPADKEFFVQRVASSVVEVIVASATLPLGLKVGRKTVKVAKKVIRKRVKRLRKATRKAVVPKEQAAEKSAKKKKKTK